MAYDTLVREAKDLPEDMIEQVIDFMRFLKYASKKEPTKHSTNNDAIFRRTINPLADEFISKRFYSKLGSSKVIEKRGFSGSNIRKAFFLLRYDKKLFAFYHVLEQETHVFWFRSY